MGKLDYNQLFLIRHGHHENGRLTEKGAEQIKKTSEIISPLLNPDDLVTPISSIEIRAVESLLVLQDNLKFTQGIFRGKPAMLEWIFTDLSVCGKQIKHFEEFVEFANRLERFYTCLAATHKETIEDFPRWYLKENFGTNFPNYESNYADGVFMDLQSGDYKIISSEKGIIVP